MSSVYLSLDLIMDTRRGSLFFFFEEMGKGGGPCFEVENGLS